MYMHANGSFQVTVTFPSSQGTLQLKNPSLPFAKDPNIDIYELKGNLLSCFFFPF